MRRDGMHYVNNGVDPDNVVEESEEERELRESVESLVNTKGYGVLHGIMVEEIGIANGLLLSEETSVDKVRFYQGYIRGIQTVQHRLLNMIKEEKR